MKNILLSTAAFLVLSTGLTFAGVGSGFHQSPTVQLQQDEFMLLVRQGRGGDDSGSDDNGGDRDDNSRDSDDNDDSSSNSNDDNQDVSGSGRKKPRVKGGSGCDGAGDVAEHAACQ